MLPIGTFIAQNSVITIAGLPIFEGINLVEKNKSYPKKEKNQFWYFHG